MSSEHSEVHVYVQVRAESFQSRVYFLFTTRVGETAKTVKKRFADGFGIGFFRDLFPDSTIEVLQRGRSLRDSERIVANEEVHIEFLTTERELEDYVNLITHLVSMYQAMRA